MNIVHRKQIYRYGVFLRVWATVILIKRIADLLGQVECYPAGNRTGLSYPNGTSVSYAYDVNNRLIQLTHKNSIGQVLASYTYTLGPTGNRTRIDEGSGIIRQYTYDKLYRLTGEQVTDPSGAETLTDDYTYDAVGNRLTKSTNNYTYNDADQLVSENGVTYTYDLNGNLSSKSDSKGMTTYGYDYDNRLISVASPSGTINYKYDVDGNRVEQTSSSGTIRYLVDTNRELAQVLAEYTPGGLPIASYTYADDLISMNRDGQIYYYHFDGLGSTRLLTDSTGAVTDTYDYDAFGNLIAQTGSTDNTFLFTGQQYDANIGFYYLRARYYQTSTGRFNAYDPVDGDPYAPLSLHKYSYAANDPANKIDPSGKQFVGLLQEIQYLIGLLFGFGILLYTAAKTYTIPRVEYPIRVFHYSRWEFWGSIMAKGIRSPTGIDPVYFSPDLYLFAEDAKKYLALPTERDLGISLLMYKYGDDLQGPRRVAPANLEDGGGFEYWTYEQPISVWNRATYFFPLL